MTAAAFFDRIAPRYRELWEESAVGKAQRAAAWREIGRVVRPGGCMLDLGCGAGYDAVRLARAGVSVDAIDVSPGMVRVARSRARDAGADEVIRFHVADLGRLEFSGQWDGAISNFGALNCVPDLPGFVERLAPALRPGAQAVICVFGNLCAWEILWHAGAGRFGTAFRRFRRQGDTTAGLPVFYHSDAGIRAAFAPHFDLIRRRGIGILVPPTSVEAAIRRCRGIVSVAGRVDEVAGTWPIVRALADHSLYLFRRR